MEQIEARTADSFGGEIYEALAKQEWERAMLVVERHWSLLSAERVDLICAVADSVSEGAMRARPHWRSVRAYAQHVRIPGHLRPTEFIDVALDPRTDADGVERVIAYTSRAAGCRSAGWFVEGAAWADRAREAYGSAPIARERLRSGAGELHWEWALGYLYADRLPDSQMVFRQAHELAMGVADLRIAGDAAAALAFIAALIGDGPSVDDWLTLYDRSRDAGQSADRVAEFAILARAVRASDALDLDGVQTEIARLDRLPVGESGVIVASLSSILAAAPLTAAPIELLSTLDAELAAFGGRRVETQLNNRLVVMARAELLSHDGRVARALVLLGWCSRSAGGWVVHGRQAALHLRLGDLENAAHFAQLAIDAADAVPRVRHTGLVVRAAVARRLGDRGLARHLFDTAIEIAQQSRLWDGFRAISRPDLVELTDDLDTDVPQELRALLAAPVRFHELSISAVLTVQEQRVVQRLLDGATRGEIAASLGVTTNTVKSHTRSVYRKLGVRTRAALALEARRRYLL